VSFRRVCDEVAEGIRQLIAGEQLSEGARLPSERDLAERFGVSRPMVSQALRMLSLMGMVEIRRGSGAYVLRRPQAMVTASVTLMLDLDHGSVGDLAELRLWLETLGAVHAAGRRPAMSAAEAAEIEAALTRLSTATSSSSEWIAADTVFHAKVVAAAGNSYLAAVYESVHTTVLGYEYDHWLRTEIEPSWLSPGTGPAQLDLHQAIYRSVIRRDTKAATAAVLRHHAAMLDHLAAARPARAWPAARPARPGQAP
jgi:GntR family transcriptional repressor for pyruvate dehydrogenase complex